jgi:actin-like ATPase involved in cell morphogenesis
VTEVERRAVREAAGGYLIETMAAAIGAGLPIETRELSVISAAAPGEIAVLSLAGSSSIAVSVLRDKWMNNVFMRLKYSLLIGEQTAEEIK